MIWHTMPHNSSKGNSNIMIKKRNGTERNEPNHQTNTNKIKYSDYGKLMFY